MKIKIAFIFTLCLINALAVGQISTSSIVGSWIKIKATYNSGADLPLNHAVNQSSVRFEFKTNGKAFKATDHLSKGFIFDYSLSGRDLKIGFINYQLRNASKDTLILVEEGINGFDGSAIKYVFVSEEIYQRNIPLTSEMIILSGKDSIFIENEKIHARFNREESFQNYLRNNIAEYSKVEPTDNFFMATFIITPNGSVDSIVIHKGINKAFDNQFVKAVKRSYKYWSPGKLGNRNVSVLHTEIFQFVSHPNFEKQYYNYQDGIMTMQRGDYFGAIDYFDKCLESNPEDKDALYQRGVCFYKLNDMDNACNDWKEIRNLKSKKADNLISKFCE